jgi:hypothetical protein
MLQSALVASGEEHEARTFSTTASACEDATIIDVMAYSAAISACEKIASRTVRPSAYAGRGDTSPPVAAEHVVLHEEGKKDANANAALRSTTATVAPTESETASACIGSAKDTSSVLSATRDVEAVMNTTTGTMHVLAARCRDILCDSSTLPGKSELLVKLRRAIVDSSCDADGANYASGAVLIAALRTLHTA